MHLDMGGTKVFIESESSRVNCPRHGVLTEKAERARHDSGFTYDFENTAARLAPHSTMITTIAYLMRIAWNTVGAIVKRVHEDIREKRGNLFNGLRRIGIDETSYKKGRKYMAVIVNHILQFTAAAERRSIKPYRLTPNQEYIRNSFYWR
jgi:transposase